MKKVQGITGLSLVALLAVSCTSKSEVTKAPMPKPSVQPVSVAPTPPQPSPAVNVPPKGLIVATNPTTIPIPKGRIDPFGSIAVAPIKQPVPAEKTQQQKTQAQKTPNPQPQQQKTQAQKTPNPQPQQQKTQAQKTPNPQPQQQKTQAQKTPNPQPQQQKTQAQKTPNQLTVQNPPLPPAPPATDLAKAVQVTGVMELGERVSAIVKEPDEKISRTVSTGDYLSKGQVLVKRIEFNSNREPVVILEQNGVEVIKSVSSNNGPVASIR
jgi:hypothetical protein